MNIADVETSKPSFPKKNSNRAVFALFVTAYKGGKSIKSNLYQFRATDINHIHLASFWIDSFSPGRIAEKNCDPYPLWVENPD